MSYDLNLFKKIDGKTVTESANIYMRKMKIFIVVILALLLVGGLSYIVYKGNIRHLPILFSIRTNDSKIYTVNEVDKIKKTNPKLLKNKNIKVKGCLIDNRPLCSMPMCDANIIIITYGKTFTDYTKLYIFRDSKPERLTKEKMEKAKEIAVIYSYIKSSFLGGGVTDKCGLFEGHFYDRFRSLVFNEYNWKDFVVKKITLE